MSNLRLINETTATSVSSISVTDVFSADFDIYKITAVGDFTNGNQVVNSRFINSSGSVVSTSNYNYAILSMESSSSFNQDRSTNNSFMRRMVYSHNGNDFGFTLYIFNPIHQVLIVLAYGKEREFQQVEEQVQRALEF